MMLDVESSGEEERESTIVANMAAAEDCTVHQSSRSAMIITYSCETFRFCGAAECNASRMNGFGKCRAERVGVGTDGEGAKSGTKPSHK